MPRSLSAAYMTWSAVRSYVRMMAEADTTGPEQGPAPVVTLRALFESWLRAIPARDLDLIAELLDESWVYVDFTGHVHDRDEYLHIVGDLVGDGHVTELVEFDARPVTADVAVAVGRYVSVGTLTNGFRAVQDSRFTSTWHRHDDHRWRSHSHQATNVGEAFE